ncbi:MAG: tRNA epoxyqueuosine(34) reductase QueG [Acidobacteria bacterium]|nr:tRNA epoxyqueuosine(34) reductase QueG [Acidobacteriota bacterium]
MTLNSEEIKNQARVLGFDKVGIVPATALTEEGQSLLEWLARGFHGQMGYMSRLPQQRSDPRLLMPSAKSVTCVALNYFRPESHIDSPEIGKISRYAWGDDYHDVLRDKLKTLLGWIVERRPDVEGKICVDTSPMMDKSWAVRAGLGWIGKHTNLITKEYSSWVFLGELLLSIELDYDSYIESDHCGKCTACIDACPTMAIIEPYQLDATRCISYGTIELRETELPEPIKSNLENWVFGCDICQDVCPWSRFSKESGEERFTPRPGSVAPKLQELVELSQEEFSKRFKNSAVKRAKLAGLKRNAREAIAQMREYEINENNETDEKV